MDAPLWAWLALGALITVALGFDLWRHREPHPPSFGQAFRWVSFYVALGLGFGIVLLATEGTTVAGEYFAGYVIEFALSMDNVFVFALVFSAFAVPIEFQHRVLFWGVLGAIVMRLAFIVVGAALLERFDWLAIVFGAFLVATGIRMAIHRDDHGGDPQQSPVLKLLRRAMPVTDDYDGQKFLTRRNGVLMATPLLAVLVVVEFTDLVFALDSVPAILAITTDTYVVFAANVFALLGLRQLYFVLAGAMDRFVYLKAGLALLLVFVGAKMVYGQFFGKVGVEVSLPVIVIILAGAIGASLLKTRGPRAPQPPRQAAASARSAATASSASSGVR